MILDILCILSFVVCFNVIPLARREEFLYVKNSKLWIVQFYILFYIVFIFNNGTTPSSLNYIFILLIENKFSERFNLSNREEISRAINYDWIHIQFLLQFLWIFEARESRVSTKLAEIFSFRYFPRSFETYFARNSVGSSAPRDKDRELEGVDGFLESRQNNFPAARRWAKLKLFKRGASNRAILGPLLSRNEIPSLNLLSEIRNCFHNGRQLIDSSEEAE